MWYYEEKFNIKREELGEFLPKIWKAYLEGINWIYSYYYTGVPSWDWYYPYFYAPLAVDLVWAGINEFNFELGKASTPAEQLMSVLPS